MAPTQARSRTVDLNPRRRRILKAVVDRHVRTATPVSSAAVVREYRLNVSPATVRIEFAALERMGLVHQPHTSAGRIPSDQGYRVYVDQILVPPRLKHDERKMIQRTYKLRYGAVEEILHATCHLLASLTGYAAIALFPLLEQERLRDLHLACVNGRRILIMIVTNEGRVEHSVFHLPTPISVKCLETVTRVLRERLRGMPLMRIVQVRVDDIISMELAREQCIDEFIITALEMVQQTIQMHHQNRIFSEGLPQVLSQPEFEDVDKARALVEVFDHLGESAIIVPPCDTHPRHPWVAIGSELLGGTARPPMEVLSECSFVGAPYWVADKCAGTIGVLGPKRMRYGKAWSIVQHIARELSNTLTTLLA
ncbi:MAG TPA: heat-inducible transcription repressor HrcA [Armatimonadetes bacterium]|nr:heat-inducible transcription repressor HrcA [Armatimonadota bacterium]